MISDRRIAARVKPKVHNMVVRLEIHGLETGTDKKTVD